MKTRHAPHAAVAPYHRVKLHLKAELVAQFGISRMTVNRALRELQSEGLVDRVQGVGTFAAQLGRVSSTLTIRDIHEEIEARGHRHHAEVQLCREERATSGLALQLGLPEGAPVFHSLLVHHDNGVALQCEDRYVNPQHAPGYLSVDFTHTTPTQHLLAVAPTWEAQFTIQSGLPTEQEAALLGVPLAEPCLVIVRRTVSRGEPVTLVRLVHPGSRYQVQGQFTP